MRDRRVYEGHQTAPLAGRWPRRSGFVESRALVGPRLKRSWGQMKTSRIPAPATTATTHAFQSPAQMCNMPVQSVARQPVGRSAHAQETTAKIPVEIEPAPAKETQIMIANTPTAKEKSKALELALQQIEKQF